MTAYNLCQNTCRLFHVLAKFAFTTSELKLVIDWILRYLEIRKPQWNPWQAWNSSDRLIWTVVQENCKKTCCKTFQRNLLLGSCRQYFPRDCLRKLKFISNLTKTPRYLYPLQISVFQKSHLPLKVIFKFDLFQKSLFCTTSASSRNLVLKAFPSGAGQYLWKGFTFLY